MHFNCLSIVSFVYNLYFHDLGKRNLLDWDQVNGEGKKSILIYKCTYSEIGNSVIGSQRHGNVGVHHLVGRYGMRSFPSCSNTQLLLFFFFFPAKQTFSACESTPHSLWSISFIFHVFLGWTGTQSSTFMTLYTLWHAECFFGRKDDFKTRFLFPWSSVQKTQSETVYRFPYCVITYPNYTPK